MLSFFCRYVNIWIDKGGGGGILFFGEDIDFLIDSTRRLIGVQDFIPSANPLE